MDGVKILNRTRDLEGISFTSGNHVFYSESKEDSFVKYDLINSYSFKYCKEGNEIYNINGYQQSLRKGEVLVINPGSRIEWSGLRKSNTTGYSAFLNPSIVNIVRSQFDSVGEILIENKDSASNEYTFFEGPFSSKYQIGIMFAGLSNDQMNSKEVDAFLSRLCLKMILVNEPLKRLMDRRKPVKKSTKLELIKRLSIANDIIRQSIYENMNLETLAKESGISKFHFSRSFKSVYGESPMQLLVRLRLQEGFQLLSKGEKPLEVALNLHFYDVSHFSKMFKSRYGRSPQTQKK